MLPNPRLLAAGVVAASGLLLVACGGQAAPPAQVVPSLPAASSSAQPTSGTAATGSDPGQPRERVDMTNDEINALYQVYSQCLAANGYDKRTNSRDTAAMTRAQAACKSKDPLPPWELDANNPHGADFVHAVVQCLRAKGVRYVDEGPPEGGRWVFSFGGPQNDSDSISKGLQYAPDCEKQVAAQGIGR